VIYRDRFSVSSLTTGPLTCSGLHKEIALRYNLAQLSPAMFSEFESESSLSVNAFCTKIFWQEEKLLTG